MAELTRLDRIGFPVWQAVRPLGRAQSVHQGKGCSDIEARIGALGEALESHRAEQVAADGPCCEWEDLAPESRCPDPRDCQTDATRDAHPGRIAWCEAADLRSGRRFHLPHLFVSLDFALPPDFSFERSSAGLAIGTCLDEAVETALLEVIERDAVGAWRRLPLRDKAQRRIAMRSIRFAWFEQWHARIDAAGAFVRVFAFEAIAAIPVCIVYLAGPEAFGSSRRLFMGSAAHGSPEVALFKALAEALQSRLTFIAGTRDDMLPSLYRETPAGSLLGGADFGQPLVAFEEVRPAGTKPSVVAERLAALGYRTVAVKRLDPGDGTVPVVKAFVPGLGSLHRTRRPPR